MKSFVAYPKDLESMLFPEPTDNSVTGKLIVHYELFKKVRLIEGSIVKCGIAAEEGFTRFAMFRNLAEIKPSQKIIAFEKITKNHYFEGFHESPQSENGTKVKALVDITQLQEMLQEKGISEKIDFIPGNLGDSIPNYLIENPDLKIAYFNIDLDDYDATINALQFFYPRLMHGGILIIDNYYKQAEDYRAVRDYFENSDIKINNYSVNKGPHFIVRQ